MFSLSVTVTDNHHGDVFCLMFSIRHWLQEHVAQVNDQTCLPARALINVWTAWLSSKCKNFVSSFLMERFYEANHHPRHATVVSTILSKPVRPLVSKNYFQYPSLQNIIPTLRVHNRTMRSKWIWMIKCFLAFFAFIFFHLLFSIRSAQTWTVNLNIMSVPL